MSTIRVEGLHELVAALTKESVLAKANGATAVARTAKKVESTAGALVPVESGELQRSIHTTISGTRAEVGPSARYGKFVEEGTYKDAPQPYMAPALDAHEDDLVEELQGLVGNL